MLAGRLLSGLGRRQCDLEERAAHAKSEGSIAVFTFGLETNRVGRSWTGELAFAIAVP